MMSTSFLSFSPSGAVNLLNSCQHRVQIILLGLQDLLCRIIACIHLAVDNVGGWANITLRANDGQPALASYFHQCGSSCWERKDAEGVSNLCSVGSTLIFVNNGPKSEPICMDHYTSPFIETLNLLGCRFSARLSRKKVSIMFGCMSFRLELWSWYVDQTWGFACEAFGWWVGDHIETSFRDSVATQVAIQVNSLSKDGPASSQVAAVMESGQPCQKWGKQRPAKSHEPRASLYKRGNWQVIETLRQLVEPHLLRRWKMSTVHG